jgi:hypothetical protein
MVNQQSALLNRLSHAQQPRRKGDRRTAADGPFDATAATTAGFDASVVKSMTVRTDGRGREDDWAAAAARFLPGAACAEAGNCTAMRQSTFLRLETAYMSPAPSTAYA